MVKHEVVSNIVLNDKFIILTLKCQGNLKFKVGQFVLVNIAKYINRAYSIASIPEEMPYWKIFVDITPGGPGTTYLKNLVPGDVILTGQPTGQFLLTRSGKYYLFAATGCGIAPFIPMIDTLLSERKHVHLFWGLRYKKEITLEDKFDKWNENKNFSSNIVLSRPGVGWEGKAGHLEEYLLGKAKAFNKDSLKIYLSGSNEFIDEAAGILKKNKIPAHKIHFEACF